ncbi:uncharacterized protein LOC108878183 [Lates calcarifer]|uniref:Uncharacterized protein LOC108878183 n=1 Tax=Lates calcarifer TaxID=8187 RepID=A0AAJ7PHB2_LATCA|nr:uncharacterized protein LOC108878183 [Lates calcarifer]XP_018524129.1 uncharacterized protein LOC108878183 [Lates calcarifer]XP_018524139.1 uncharacterized protein LOC108878183 [Lates calcarifer]XP_018524150.1 uncharacterized protein LOC108878183 [Lates calcarifer]
MYSLMNGDQSLTLCGRRRHSKTKTYRPRHLHQSTLTLGDTAPCYTTTHTQSYSGLSADGRPLIFHLRDPGFPSQHHNCLDLSNVTALQCPQLSHTKDVHRPQHITPRTDPTAENWARYRSGQAVREITNPQDPSEYWTTYRLEHTPPVTDGSTQLAGGRPTQWHQHNILTGEQKQTAGPEKPSRQIRDEPLWAARRWETDCSALRLY